MSSPVSLELKRSEIENDICKNCSACFSAPTAFTELASERGLEYARDRNSLLRSAIAGCKLCRELLCSPHSYTYPNECPDPSNPYSKYIYVRSGWDDDSRSWPINLWRAALTTNEKLLDEAAWYDKSGNSEYRFYFRGQPSTESYIKVSLSPYPTYSQGILFNISCPLDDPVSRYIPYSTISGNVDNDRTWTKLRNWLNTCDKSHSICCKNRGSTIGMVPAFVVDVSPTPGDLNTIKLVSTEGKSVKYAALSYCWGGDQPTSTNFDNFAVHLSCISLASLPQTLRDAVKATRALQLQYLWVDSLCILQDSDEQKAEEIGKMEHVFAQAYVTISASCAETCHHGFLHPRKPHPYLITLPCQCPNGSWGTINLRVIGGPYAKDYYIPNPEPISRRAWAFQEAFMSSRLLIYSKHQLFWLCSETWGKEGGRYNREEYFHEEGKTLKARELSLQVLPNPSIHDWRIIAAAFSPKQLTNPHDKLPALSGVAGHFARVLNAQYLAGIWYGNIAEGLSWHQNRINEWIVRSPVWRAPSWSFMSIDGHIDFVYDIENNRPGNSEPLFTEVVYDFAPRSSKAPFGRLDYAKLEMTTRLLEAVMDEDPASARPSIFDKQPNHHPSLVAKSIAKLNDRSSSVFMHFDTFRRTVAEDGSVAFHIMTNYGSWKWSDSLWLLAVGQKHSPKDSYPKYTSWGIALAKLPDGQFHRIGYFEELGFSWKMYSQQPKQRITIV